MRRVRMRLRQSQFDQTLMCCVGKGVRLSVRWRGVRWCALLMSRLRERARSRLRAERIRRQIGGEIRMSKAKLRVTQSFAPRAQLARQLTDHLSARQKNCFDPVARPVEFSADTNGIVHRDRRKNFGSSAQRLIESMQDIRRKHGVAMRLRDAGVAFLFAQCAFVPAGVVARCGFMFAAFNLAL